MNYPYGFLCLRSVWCKKFIKINKIKIHKDREDECMNASDEDILWILCAMMNEYQTLFVFVPLNFIWLDFDFCFCLWDAIVCVRSAHFYMIMCVSLNVMLELV